MKRFIHTIIIAIVAVTIISCNSDIPIIEKPIYPEIDNENISEVEDDDSPDPSGIFDYSLIGAHPRLLFNNEDFQIIKQNINKNDILKKIHNIIINRCDNEFVGAQDIVYKKNGKRLLGVSRQALERVCYLAYGYKTEAKYTYLAQAEKDIKSVCLFEDWNPSHYLDVAEMSLAVAIGLDWLYDDLKPETRQLARNALENFAFRTAIDNNYNNQFLNSKNNWNQVCNGALLAAALTIYEKDKKRSVEIIEQCYNSNINNGINAYGDDGNYPEGYMYWGYGTTYQVLMISVLEKIFNTDNGLSEKSLGFLKTPEYMLFMAGTTGKCFNYSDCTESEEPKLPMWWFAKKRNDSSLLFNELRLLNNGGYDKTYEEQRLLPIIMSYINIDQLSATINPPTKKLWWGGTNVDTTPVVLIHTDWTYGETDKYFGIKGGRSNTSHGHMDGGTFVYDAYGERWIMDLGMQTYAPLEAAGINLWGSGQLSSRWNVFRLNNYSHNVITINDNNYHYKGGTFIVKDFMQNLGAKLSAKLECCAINRYGTDYDVDNIFRTATLIPKGSDFDLEIIDEIKSRPNKEPLIKWNITTPAEVKVLDNNTIELAINNKILYMHINIYDNNKQKNVDNFSIEIWKPVLQNFDEDNPNVNFVCFKYQMNENENFSFNVRFSKDNDN